MATTQNTFNGTGSNLGPFSFTFKWLESTDIKVTVGGVLKTAGTHYNLQGLNYTTKTGGQVLFTAGNAPPTGTNNIRIYRDTDDAELSATFSSGSAIRAKDLNDNFTQNLYVTQEVNNNSVNIDGSNTMVGNLDMGGYRVINNGVPTNDNDAVTKKYVDDRTGNVTIPGHTYWRYVAVGGETTLTGPGTGTGTLQYSATREQVFLNGALQQRTVDYTANNGTSITFNVALTAGDVVDVRCVNNLASGNTGLADDIVYGNQFTGQVSRSVATKLSDVVSVKDFGAVGDGVTDDTAAIQAAIAEASSRAANYSAGGVGKACATVDFGGGLYAVSDTLVITKPIRLLNGNLKAIAAPSTQDCVLYLNSEGIRLENVSVDGGLSGTTRYANCVQVVRERIRITGGHFVHFPDYGIRIPSTSQEAVIDNCLIREWLYAEAGTADGTLRTAVGLDVKDNDNIFSNVVVGQCLKNLYVQGGANLFSNCHFYNGASTTTTEDVTAHLFASNSNLFAGCYFDNGTVVVENGFANVFSGSLFLCTASATNSQAIELKTSTASESGAGFTLTGCVFRLTGGEIPIVYTTTGSGSWLSASQRKINIAGNIGYQGDSVFARLQLGNALLAYDASLRLGTPTTTDFAVSAPQNLIIKGGADGSGSLVLGASNAQVMQVTSSSLEPMTDNAPSLGTTSKRFFQTVQSRMQLYDGVSTPNTVAGFATIYIDSADGDLKIKFGDGTIKTIVTDT